MSHGGLAHPSPEPCPDLCFLGEKQGQPPKKTRIFLSAEPLRSLERRKKRSKTKNKKNKDIPGKNNRQKKLRKPKESKERKIRVVCHCRMMVADNARVAKFSFCVLSAGSRLFQDHEKGGFEFKGGSRHDCNRHDRQNRQNRQNRHGCLIL